MDDFSIYARYMHGIEQLDNIQTFRPTTLVKAFPRILSHVMNYK
jgi:hypothetical protein